MTPDEAQDDLQKLDVACDKVAELLQRCAEHVNQGRLSSDEIMLRMNMLAARLMGGQP